MTTEQNNKLDAIYKVLGKAEVNSFELLTVRRNERSSSTINMNGYKNKYKGCVILDYMTQWTFNGNVSSGRVTFKNTLNAIANTGLNAGIISIIIVEDITDSTLTIYRSGAGTASDQAPKCYGF